MWPGWESVACLAYSVHLPPGPGWVMGSMVIGSGGYNPYIYIYIFWVFPKIMVPPKSSILIGFSIINHPLWGTFIFGNTHLLINKKVQVFEFEQQIECLEPKFANSMILHVEEKVKYPIDPNSPLIQSHGPGTPGHPPAASDPYPYRVAKKCHPQICDFSGWLEKSSQKYAPNGGEKW